MLPVLADRPLNRNFYRWDLIRCSIEFAFGRNDSLDFYRVSAYESI